MGMGVAVVRLGWSIDTEFEYADGGALSGLDGKLDLVRPGG